MLARPKSAEDSRLVTIPYGSAQTAVRVPEGVPFFILTPRPVVPSEDPLSIIQHAFQHPLDVPEVEILARNRRKVVLIIDDLTRLTPVKKILPVLLERLFRAGVRREQVTILIALGTHRPMTEDEILSRVGAEICSSVRVVNHEHWKPEALADFGTTEAGTPVKINKIVTEADLVIGVGSVFPHHIAGYSGGSKIIQPGVSGTDTTAATHLLSVRTRRSYLGMLDNPVRREMDRVAQKAGLVAVINCVLNREGMLVDAFFGSPGAALKAAARRADEIYGVCYSRLADVVVAGTFPADIEFWQAHKALYPADAVVKDGGVIIIVTPCPEGLAVTHPDLAELASLSSRQLEELVDDGQVKDRVAAALAIAWAKIKERAQIFIVSDGIDKALAEKIGFIHFDSAQIALEQALKDRRHAGQAAFIPYAPETLPILEAVAGGE